MTIRRHVAALVFVAIAIAARAASSEPVTSLRVMDKQLSTIQSNLQQLKTATRAARARDIRRIRASVAQIHVRATRLKASYRARHQRFGVKMFGDLEKKSLALSHAFVAFEHARSAADRDRLLDRVSQATLPVVLQYQAISANIAANRCEARQWACCEPKANPETNRGAAQGCRWTCVSKPRSCVGFTGPQTPAGVLSAP